MIDTRAVAQEVQEQLLAAVHKGREQFRKGQEQVYLHAERNLDAVVRRNETRSVGKDRKTSAALSWLVL